MNTTRFQGLPLKVIVISCLTLLFSGQLLAQQPHQVRMAMVGNSITYGAGLPSPSQDCYPSQLDTMLQAVLGDTVLIGNYGVSGRTMLRKTSNPIWIEPQFKTALESVPDICLILLGTNDTKPERWNQWGDEFLGDYLAMIDTFRYRNPDTRFIVCYPPPIWPGHPFGTTFESRHNDSVLVNHLIPLIDSVVARTGATLIDFHTPFEDSVHLFPDQLHPGVTASTMMARMVYDTLMKTGLIDQVDPGRTYVTLFRQSPLTVPNGNNVTLAWKTIFADSVFLDGVPVAANGNQQLVAETGKVYTLTSKNAKNTIEAQLVLSTTPGTGTADLLSSRQVKVYPNPVGETLFVEVTDLPARTMSIRVFNTAGQLVISHDDLDVLQATSVIELNTDSLPQGVYVYEVQSGDKRAGGKFRKE